MFPSPKILNLCAASLLACILAGPACLAEDTKPAADAKSSDKSAIALEERQTYQDGYSFSIQVPDGYKFIRPYEDGPADSLKWSTAKDKSTDIYVFFRPKAKLFGENQVERVLDEWTSSFQKASAKVKGTKELGGKKFATLDFQFMQDAKTPAHSYVYGYMADEGMYILPGSAPDTEKAKLEVSRAVHDSFQLEPSKPVERTLSDRRNFKLGNIDISIKPPQGYRLKSSPTGFQLLVVRADGSVAGVIVKQLDDPKSKTENEALKNMLANRGISNPTTTQEISGKKFVTVDFEENNKGKVLNRVGVAKLPKGFLLLVGMAGSQDDMQLVKSSQASIQFEAPKEASGGK